MPQQSRPAAEAEPDHRQLLRRQRRIGLPLLLLSTLAYLVFQLSYALAPAWLARPTPGLAAIPLGVSWSVVLIMLAIGCTLAYLRLSEASARSAAAIRGGQTAEQEDASP